MSLFLYSMQRGINICMQTFQEYYNGDNMMNANAVSVKQGGKSIMRAGRKHENLKRQEYQHKCPHVRNCMHNGAPITLAGQPLVNALQMYGMEFQPGVTNGIGNSDVEVVMFEDEEGHPKGTIQRKAE
jgi:hypothetical protein